MADTCESTKPIAADTRLWCLHVSGMDDVHPAPDRPTAQRWATQFMVMLHQRNPKPDLLEPVVNFTVQVWPHSPESHAAGLAASIAFNTWPTDPLCSAPREIRPEAMERLRTAAQAMLPKNVCLTNPRWPDETVVPLETTLGELRALSVALSCVLVQRSLGQSTIPGDATSQFGLD